MGTALEDLSKQDLLKVISSRGQVLGFQNEKLVSLSKDSFEKDKKIVLLTRERDNLSQERDRLARERDYLRAQVEMLKRMQFGQKRERFEGDPDQIMLPFGADLQAVQEQQEEVGQKIEYIRKRTTKGVRSFPNTIP